MKKLFLLFILCITTIATKAQSGDAKGEWSGQLNVFGQKLTLVFHLNDENCTLDSPDQGIKGVPAKLERTETGIKVSVSSINASYVGINKVDSITGIFKQRGVSFPLILKPGTMKRKRPQTPVAPFPYQTQKVSFNNGDVIAI